MTIRIIKASFSVILLSSPLRLITPTYENHLNRPTILTKSSAKTIVSKRTVVGVLTRTITLYTPLILLGSNQLLIKYEK